jgi:transcriptional regulator with XRE-family HTH domain/catechol 2,3-dioxygenase-like lactoylglutathione lyase family enzyme
MNPLEKMEQELKKSLPSVWTRIRRAKSKTGNWFLDAKLDDHVVIATWSPRHGLGLSASAMGEGYGEGPEEVFPDPASATARAIQLLKEKAHTAPPQEVFLRELRAITGVTQAELAERLGVQQAAVSKLERRSDITLASLRRFVAALGAQLEINVRTKSGEVVRLLETREPKTSSAACEHVETTLERHQEKIDEWFVDFSRTVRERLLETQKIYSELLDTHFGVHRDWMLKCDDQFDDRNQMRLASSTDDGVVNVSPARAWFLSTRILRKCSSREPQERSTVEEVFHGALRYLVAHEMGHFVAHFPKVAVVGCGGTGSFVMQQLAAEPELRADTIAGWLAAKTSDDPLIGAEVAAELGCDGPRCSHPDPLGRSSTYVRGFAWGARDRYPDEGPRLENVVLYTSDLDRSREFYEELGLALTEERHGNGPKHYSCFLGSTVFELYPCSDQRRAGFTRLALTWSGASTSAASCAGVKQVRAIGCSAGTRGVVVTDPDGNRIEMKRASASPDASALVKAGG